MNKFRFLPQDYEAPKGASHYMKLEEGVTRLRILSEPILGWEDWHDKKPVRYPFDQKPESSYDPKRPVKHFWAMIVWNYNNSSIQILHITQASIRKGIEALVNDEDWGAPYFYDMKITKRGEGVDTEYTVNPVAPSPLSHDIKRAFNDKPIWLEALFDNEDPFKPSESGKITPGIFDATELSPQPVQSKKPAPKAKSEPEAEIGLELELFMDFLPDDTSRDKVEEYVELCSGHSKQTPEVYMAKAMGNIPQFLTYFNQWLALPKNRKAVTSN